MWRKISVVLLVLVLSISSFHCKKKVGVKGIELDIQFSEEKLSDNLITDMTYSWKTDSEFMQMGQDLNIYAHFWHKNNLLFEDSHAPEVPVSDWEPGREYTYTRRIHIPTFIDEFDPDFKGEEELSMTIGFYSPYDRTGKSKQDVLQRKLKVFPPPLDMPEIIYEEGWHNLEINPESYLKQWRWTSQEARCIIDNPGRDALLVIKGGVNIEALPDQRIIVKIEDLILDEFIPKESYFEKSYNVKKEMLGGGEEFFLTIATDKTFVPAKVFPQSKDERELGLQVSLVYFR
jgi:hypothetical protein